MSVSAPIHGRLHGAIARKSPLTAGGVGVGFVDIVNNGVLAPFVTFTRNSEATRTNAAGQVELVAANEPRIDYDPVTLELRGLLIEEQRTNLLLWSQGFDNSTMWGFNNITVTPNGAIAPDGTLTADILTVTTTGTANSSNTTVINATATSMAYSIYTKKGTRTTAQFLLRNNTTGTNFDSGIFNYDTGNITGNGWTAQNVGNGWYRLTYARTTDITIGDRMAFYIGATGGPLNAGDSWLVWGAQLEAGAFATSYIPTAGTTQTRAIDDPDFTIPAGIVRLNYTYDDDTTADVAVTPGAAYQIPTGQKRIKHLRGYRS